MFMTISQPTWIRRETTRDESHTSFQCGIHERRWRSSNGNSWQSQTVLFLLLISVSGSCSLDRSLYLVLLLICRTQQNCSYRRNSCSKRRSLSCFSRCCPKTLLSRTSYKVSLVASLIANHRLSRCSILLTITMPRISSSKLGPQEKKHEFLGEQTFSYFKATGQTVYHDRNHNQRTDTTADMHWQCNMIYSCTEMDGTTWGLSSGDMKTTRQKQLWTNDMQETQLERVNVDRLYRLLWHVNELKTW